MVRKHLARYVLAAALSIGALTYMWNNVWPKKPRRRASAVRIDT